MKKTYFIPLVLPLVFLPAQLIYADFIVHLKNGQQIPASHHWQEEDEIKINTGQGVMGVPKKAVARIEETPDQLIKPLRPKGVVTPKADKAKSAEKKSVTAKMEPGSPKPAAAPDPLPHVKRVEWNKGKNDTEINEQYQDLKKQFDDTVASLNKTGAESLLNQFAELRNTIVARNVVGNYASEMVDIHALIDSLQNKIDGLGQNN